MTGASERTRRVQAYGLQIEARFSPPGLPESRGGEGRRTVLRLARADELGRDWPAQGTTRLLEERLAAGHERTIDMHPHAGYRLCARGFGLARVSQSGDDVACTPQESAGHGWQQFLIGRVLPWASVLRGYETLHASAVAVGERAVAFIGPTGAGKSSLALQLVSAGARFVTDDVLALDAPDGHPLAHPGPALLGVRSAPSAVKTYSALTPVTGPLPLAALYFIAPGEGSPIEPLVPFDPRVLLASTFVFAIRDAHRLANQLDICSAVARHAAPFVVRPAASSGVAERVADHLAGVTA